MYACILGLAGAAWVGDRLFLSGGPDDAGAGTMPVVSPEAAALPAAPGRTVASTPARNEPALSDRLESLRVTLEGPPAPDDAFEVPETWRTPAPATAAETAVQHEFDTAEFIRTHKLTGVVIGPRSDLNAAVVNGGSLLRPGQTLDGLTLKEVSAQSAIFERDGVEVKLRIDRITGTGGKVDGASENGAAGGESR